MAMSVRQRLLDAERALAEELTQETADEWVEAMKEAGTQILDDTKAERHQIQLEALYQRHPELRDQS
jgi:truncated hemoglobin YjbI